MSSGWTVGQHVRLRVFFDGRLFESHPLTIMCAPPSEGCLARPLPSLPPPTLADAGDEDSSDDKGSKNVHRDEATGESTENRPSDDGNDIQVKSRNDEEKGGRADSNASEYAGSGILLGARAVGDWTKALNEFALREGKKLRAQHRRLFT